MIIILVIHVHLSIFLATLYLKCNPCCVFIVMSITALEQAIPILGLYTIPVLCHFVSSICDILCLFLTYSGQYDLLKNDHTQFEGVQR